MKKLISLILVILVLCSFSAVSFAEDTGIQMIGGPAAEETETVNMDDIKVGDVASIPGFAQVTILKAGFADSFLADNQKYFKSDTEADYLYVLLEILNTQYVPVDFYKKISDDIVCNFGDGYQFGGWKRQYTRPDGYPYADKEKSFEINPLYTGVYMVVVTLPNAVVASKEPLSVTFKIGENEFTYNERK